MATIRQRKGANGPAWQAIIRKKGYGTISKSFSAKTDAESWVKEVETGIELDRLRTLEDQCCAEDSGKPKTFIFENPKELLSIEDMAVELGTTKVGVYSRIARRSLPAPFKIGGQSYWRRADWQAWLEKQAIEQGAYVTPANKEPQTPTPRRRGRPRKE